MTIPSASQAQRRKLSSQLTIDGNRALMSSGKGGGGGTGSGAENFRRSNWVLSLVVANSFSQGKTGMCPLRGYGTFGSLSQ